MRWHRIRIYIFFIISLSSCTIGVNEKPINTEAINSGNNRISESPSTTLSISADRTMTPNLLNTPLSTYSTPTPNNVITPTSKYSPTSITQEQCPYQKFSNPSKELKEGTTIFSFQGPSSPQGIWGISSTSSAPYQVTNIDKMPIGAILSADKNHLAWINYSADAPVLIIFDIRNSQASIEPANPKWHIVENWASDGKLRILTKREELQTVGIANTYDLYDPVTKHITKINEDFKLPGFQVDTNVWWRGFASINPSRNMVLYTADNGYNTDFVLRNTIDNIEIWRYVTTSYQDNIPIANWTKDGRYVTFVAEDKQDKLQHILDLDISSLKLSEITNSSNWIRQLSWSDDRRYLLASKSFGYWNKGPGFIINPQTGKEKEICDEGYDFGVGYWIENTNLLLYTMYSDSNTKVELLNAITWETQDIFELGPDIYINYIGWTPVTPSP